MHNAPHVIGLDFGTDSVRALLVNAITGEEIDSAVFNYPRWSQGLYCDAQKTQFRQHPLDHIEGLTNVIRNLTAAHPEIAKQIKAVSADTTGSSPCLVDKECRPLALRPEYAENPNAMFVLWKDHTGEKESAEITALCAASPVDYSVHTGGHYSSENFWSKITHIFRDEPEIKKHAHAAIELCDFIPALLAGVSNTADLKMGYCAVSQKWLWSERWGGYPPPSFFAQLEPDLPEFASRLNTSIYTCDQAAGTITEEWADRLGLPRDVKIGTGTIDAHCGAVGAGVAHKTMALNIGTSACYMTVVPREILGDRMIKGIYGQGDHSIIPGLVGFEMGLSAFGDVYAWLQKFLSYPLVEILRKSNLIDNGTKQKLIAETHGKILRELDAMPAVAPDENAPFATDWLNGRRSPSADFTLTGSLMGLRLSTTAPQIYHALVEATAFATKTAIAHLVDNGIEIERLVAAGGIPQKSPLVMQTLADVLGREIQVTACHHTGALGAAIQASVVAGVHANVQAAQKALCKPAIRAYAPNMESHKIHLRRYENYKAAGAFTEKRI
ncbi:L-ribulokinase [Ereboglobus sp. PH5-5]|uniref:ribulokinase n=1 Tax=Ereboglobus sp. PH5-5 TaxID=2940529 RepID=UPI002404CA4B|nr:ribulokinase [Ereboglobus sp. PH5-5]MDF9833274.1 L-ribulokinase [Ereboglobus sp. PH5-5]